MQSVLKTDKLPIFMCRLFSGIMEALTSWSPKGLSRHCFILMAYLRIVAVTQSKACVCGFEAFLVSADMTRLMVAFRNFANTPKKHVRAVTCAEGTDEG